MALPEQEMLGRFAARSGILSPAPPFTTVPRRHRRRSSFAARAVRHLPAALPFAHRSPDRTTATHAVRGPPAPTTEKKGFGAFAHHPIAGERAKTAFDAGTVPERSRRRT